MVSIQAVIGIMLLVDLLLLLGTNRILGYPPGYGRCFLAAALGSLLSGLCMVPGLSFLNEMKWRLICMGIQSAVAYGMSKTAIRKGLIFVGLSMGMGSAALQYGRGEVLPLLICLGILWLFCCMGADDGGMGTEMVPVQLTYGENTVRVMALRDTGNTLRDPISGEQVLVVSAQVAGTLTGLTRHQLAHPMETLVQKPLSGLRLIPYRTIGGTGMLLALRINNAAIGTKKQNALVAFAPEGFSKQAGYQALTGGVL